MTRARDEGEAARLLDAISCYERECAALPGVKSERARLVLVDQLIESGRRVEYIKRLLTMDLGDARADPTSTAFDPIKAAIIQHRRGDEEEAYWLALLSVHFGKHRRGGWQYVRDVYGRLGRGGRWSWQATSSDVPGFRSWLETFGEEVRSGPGGFGNHRKYESLRGATAGGTGAVVESYLAWAQGSQGARVREALSESDGSAEAFDSLYDSLDAVTRFGRTARFDFLSLIDRLELADIAPGHAYLAGATGPLRGARLLYGDDDRPTRELEALVVELETYLGVGFDPLEDALCNWQKSPLSFKPFRG